MTFESPLTPVLNGVASVKEFLTGLFPAIRDVRPRQHIVEGEYVVTLFDFDLSRSIRASYIRIYDGSIPNILFVDTPGCG